MGAQIAPNSNLALFWQFTHTPKHQTPKSHTGAVSAVIAPPSKCEMTASTHAAPSHHATPATPPPVQIRI